LATLTGMFSAIRVLISVVSAPVIGHVSDILHKRWIVMAGIFFLGSIGLWLMGDSILIVAILGAALSSIAGGGIPSLAPAYIGDHVSRNQHGRALSIVYSVGDLGSALGPPIALALVPLLGVGVIYRYCAILMLLGMVLSLFMIKPESGLIMAKIQFNNKTD